jgi:hypothetical protein
MKTFTYLLMASFAMYFLGSLSADLDLRGEFLYFKPTSDQPYYAIPSTRNVFGENIFPDGTRHANHSQFHPGFRLEMLLGLCHFCDFLDFRFTYLRSKHSDSVKGAFLFDTIGFPGDGAQAPEDTSYAGRAQLQEGFRYVAVDIAFRRICLGGFLDHFTFIAGLHFAYIRHRDNFVSSGSFIDDGALKIVGNHLTRISQFWSGGPLLGLIYKYLVCGTDCDGLSLKADGRAALLLSRAKARFRYVTSRTGERGVNIHNQGIWRISPYLDARLGVDYHFTYCASDVHIEAGYELIWYHNGIDSIVGYDVAFPGDSIDVYSNLNLHGPYLAISTDF